jgi:hypothetical protein
LTEDTMPEATPTGPRAVRARAGGRRDDLVPRDAD